MCTKSNGQISQQLPFGKLFMNFYNPSASKTDGLKLFDLIRVYIRLLVLGIFGELGLRDNCLCKA